MSYLGLLAKIATVDRLRATTGLPVVDRELLVSFSGGPELPAVHLILQTERESSAAQPEIETTRAQVRHLLAERGYPPEYAAIADVEVVSREAIEAAGGKFNFLR